MMKFELSTKIKTAIFLLLASTFAMAEPVALVNSVQGKAFAVLGGNTVSLSRGDIVKLNSEVLVEEGSQVTLTDYYDHELHLKGGSHMKVFKKYFELKRGTVWLQSYNQTSAHMIKTANSVVGFIYGEAIVSFDNKSGKTQLFSMEGSFSFSNVLKMDVKTRVDSGHFSFVDPKYNEGTPRNPTKIGYKSFQTLTTDFRNVEKMTANWELAESKHPLNAEKMVKPIREKEAGSITFVSAKPKKRKQTRASRKIASISSLKPYKKYKKSGVKVRIFGGSAPAKPAPKAKKASSRGRNPASIAPAAVPAEVTRSGESEFKKAFRGQYDAQKRHSGAVNSLIDELKSYQVDYQKEY